MFGRAMVLLPIFIGLLQTPVVAQAPPILVSPDVRLDRTIVFRFWAPKATEVQLSGDWMSGPPVALTKDAQGLWTITQGPLEPDIYQYSFLVDGARADDPACRCTYAFGAGRGASNRFTIAASRRRRGKSRIGHQARFITSGSIRDRSGACAGWS